MKKKNLKFKEKREFPVHRKTQRQEPYPYSQRDIRRRSQKEKEKPFHKTLTGEG